MTRPIDLTLLNVAPATETKYLDLFNEDERFKKVNGKYCAVKPDIYVYSVDQSDLERGVLIAQQVLSRFRLSPLLKTVIRSRNDFVFFVNVDDSKPDAVQQMFAAVQNKPTAVKIAYESRSDAENAALIAFCEKNPVEYVNVGFGKWRLEQVERLLNIASVDLVAISDVDNRVELFEHLKQAVRDGRLAVFDIYADEEQRAELRQSDAALLRACDCAQMRVLTLDRMMRALL